MKKETYWGDKRKALRTKEQFIQWMRDGKSLEQMGEEIENKSTGELGISRQRAQQKMLKSFGGKIPWKYYEKWFRAKHKRKLAEKTRD